MDIIYTDKHRLRAAKTELYGGELVPPFECPERMDYILEAIDEKSLGPVIAPDENPTLGAPAIAAIHDAGYLAFLDTAWQEWEAEGMKGEMIPTVWPSRSMPSPHIPNFIEGKLGYYALSCETSIAKNTVEAAYASAQVALTGADMIASGKNQLAFSLCRPRASCLTRPVWRILFYQQRCYRGPTYARSRREARCHFGCGFPPWKRHSGYFL